MHAPLFSKLSYRLSASGSPAGGKSPLSTCEDKVKQAVLVLQPSFLAQLLFMLFAVWASFTLCFAAWARSFLLLSLFNTETARVPWQNSASLKDAPVEPSWLCTLL